jgi:hypothetical protein
MDEWYDHADNYDADPPVLDADPAVLDVWESRLKEIIDVA